MDNSSNLDFKNTLAANESGETGKYSETNKSPVQIQPDAPGDVLTSDGGETSSHKMQANINLETETHSCEKSMCKSEIDESEKTVAIEQNSKLRSLRQRKSTDALAPTPPKKKRHSSTDNKSNVNQTKQGTSEPMNTTEKTSPKQTEKRKLLPRRSGIEWKVGCKLEAMDFLKKWYKARIIEVDEEEAEVLIHFDNWSSRFDEWVGMKSERLRAMSQASTSAATPKVQHTLPQITMGSMVLAKWSNKKATTKYPAVVRSIASKKKVNIEFYDGIEIQTDTTSVQSLHPDLQSRAADIWNMMKQIGEDEIRQRPESSTDSKASRRALMASNKLHQDRISNAEALLSKLIEDASKVGTQEVVSKTEPVTSERVASKSAVQSGTKSDGKVSAARKAAIKLTKVDQHSPKQETDRTGKVKVEKSLKHSADGESGSYRPQSSGSKKLGSDLEQDRKRLSGTIEPPAISTPDTQLRSSAKRSKPSEKGRTSNAKGSRRKAAKADVNIGADGDNVKTQADKVEPLKADAEKIAALKSNFQIQKNSAATESTEQQVDKGQKRALSEEHPSSSSLKRRKLNKGKKTGSKLTVAEFSKSKLTKKDGLTEPINDTTPPYSPNQASTSSAVSQISSAVVALSDVINDTNVSQTSTHGSLSIHSKDSDSTTPNPLVKLGKSELKEACVDITPSKISKSSEKNEPNSSFNEEEKWTGDEINVQSFTPTTKRLLNSVAVVNLEKTDLFAVMSSASAPGVKPDTLSTPAADTSTVDSPIAADISASAALSAADSIPAQEVNPTAESPRLSSSRTANSALTMDSEPPTNTTPKTVNAPTMASGAASISKRPSSTTTKPMALRRQSQNTESKAKYGYTMILEPIDAKPSKAFEVKEHHSQFQCAQCTKAFRKQSFLTAHIKYYHSASASSSAPLSVVPTPKRRRQKTISVCSSGSESVNTAPSTPLASPTPSKEASGSKKHSAKSHSKDTVDIKLEYETDTDEESITDPSYQTEIVNCKCGFNEEDDLMIQCEFCCCWQHAECFNIAPGELPDNYVCFVCLKTPGVRDSCKYMYDQRWLRDGTLPKLSTSATSGNTVTSNIEKLMCKSNKQLKKAQYQLSSLRSIDRLLDSSSKGDMYELALWSQDDGKDCSDGAAQDNAAQENVLLYIQDMQSRMMTNLDSIEAQMSELEAKAKLDVAKSEELVTCKDLETLLSDLKKVEKFSHLARCKTEEIDEPETIDVDTTMS